MTPETMAGDLSVIAPEIVLALGSMLLLLVGVFRGDKGTALVSWLSVALLLGVGFIAVQLPAERIYAFSGSVVLDPFGTFLKVIALGGSALAIVMALGYLRAERLERFEFPILILLAALGMLIMISAHDLITLYLGLELQSLALYVLAAFNRDSQRATEAGLKYFVLGALSSGMLLYGASLIYGFSGTTNFSDIAGLLSAEVAPMGLIVGLVFLSAGLAFKVSAVPFHMWTPDVYEGAPTPVTAFLAAAPKAAAFAVLIRVMLDMFPPLVDQWQPIIFFTSVGSMILGAFGAIGQTNIKRLLAYSTIGHMGYALVGLAAGTEEGVRSVLIYLAIYAVTNIGLFACVLSMRLKEGMVETTSSLSGLSQRQPFMAFAIMLFMFSLAGVPPLAGFFGKWFVFAAAVDAGLVPLAVIGVLSSVVGAFYYLRIVKIMYFDEPAAPFEGLGGFEMRSVLAASAAFTLFFALFAFPLLSVAGMAASSLLTP